MNNIEEQLLQRITINPEIMVGKPSIRGMRITVEQILKALAAGLSFDEMKDDFPFLEKEDIRACLLYASRLVEEEKVYNIRA